MNYEELFADATKNTEELTKRSTTSSKKRDERLIGCNETKTIIFRFIPDYTGDKAIFNLAYNSNMFKAKFGKSGNVYLGASPTLWGEVDHVAEIKSELYNADNDAYKELFPSERVRGNVFIVEDTSVDSDDKGRGQIRVLDMGNKQPYGDNPRTGSPYVKFLNKVLADEDSGVKKEANFFDLTKSGTTIKMTIVKPKDAMPEIEFSIYHGKKDAFFDKMTQEKAMKLMKEHSHDLMEMTIDKTPKTRAEIETIINTRLLGISTSSSGGQELSQEDFVKSMQNNEPDLTIGDDDLADEPDPQADVSDTPTEGKTSTKKDDLDAELDKMLEAI